MKYADISIFEELMDPRLEIFDMEFTNTEFTQFSLAVVLIRVVEFRSEAFFMKVTLKQCSYV